MPEASIRPTLVKLPSSSSRAQRSWAHIQLITRVPREVSVPFEGTLYAPGAWIPETQLGPHPVIVECVGPVGRTNRGVQREVLWILWVYQCGEWVEIARATARNWEWMLVFREPILRALNPQPQLVEILTRSRNLAGELMRDIDRRVEPEIRDVQANALHAVYSQVAGRIALLAG